MKRGTNRTAKGNVTATARKKYGTVADGKFPIFDTKSAKAAIKLRGHATPAQQKVIVAKAAKYGAKPAKKGK